MSVSKKILNLYAGIGGNRKLWDEIDEIEVTAVEWDEDIASIYQNHFPNDEVIVTDAHKYLEDHYDDGWDFVWSSPPCPTHSKIRRIHCLADEEKQGYVKPKYPNMKLYEEILFLEGYFEGKFCVENVESWYKPLVKPKKLQRHYFWTNFIVPKIKLENDKITGGSGGNIDFWEKHFGFDLSNYDLKSKKKQTILRNCVHPKLGKHILECAFKKKQLSLEDIND